MPRSPQIGRYQHTPGAQMAPGPDGRLRPTRVRRRCPVLALVVSGYGFLTPLVCLGVTRLFQLTGNGRFMPRRYAEQALPQAPSMENVLFGAGLPELVLAGALAGWLLWSLLWKLRLPADVQERGPRATIPRLLPAGLSLGILFALLMLPVAALGFCIRAMPPDVPWFIRPFFGVIGAIPVTFTALFTGTVPLVTMGLGLLMGVVTAVGVGLLWPSYPEEAVS